MALPYMAPAAFTLMWPGEKKEDTFNVYWVCLPLSIGLKFSQTIK